MYYNLYNVLAIKNQIISFNLLWNRLSQIFFEKLHSADAVNTGSMASIFSSW
jgi:hypothetical protein